ncbi:MAG: hypothetical protein ACM3WU_03310 [Bacillota bacterium]
MQLPNCLLDELEKDRELGAVERAIYLLAWAKDPPTIRRLADMANISRNKAARACRRLAAQGWMTLVKHPKGIRPAAVIPHRCQIVMAHDLEDEYEMVQWKGEFLARKRMDWYLSRDEYVCNARPKLLTHPITKKPLELDTFDRKNALGTEYNGSQHYRETADYKQADVDTQQVNDLLKASLSAKHGITLLTFTYRDLRPGVLERRLDEAVPHLKRGHVDLGGPYMKVLNRICDNYAAKVERAEKLAEQKKVAEQRKASEQKDAEE